MLNLPKDFQQEIIENAKLYDYIRRTEIERSSELGYYCDLCGMQDLIVFHGYDAQDFCPKCFYKMYNDIKYQNLLQDESFQNNITRR